MFIQPCFLILQSIVAFYTSNNAIKKRLSAREQKDAKKHDISSNVLSSFKLFAGVGTFSIIEGCRGFKGPVPPPL